MPWSQRQSTYKNTWKKKIYTLWKGLNAFLITEDEPEKPRAKVLILCPGPLPASQDCGIGLPWWLDWVARTGKALSSSWDSVHLPVSFRDHVGSSLIHHRGVRAGEALQRSLGCWGSDKMGQVKGNVAKRRWPVLEEPMPFPAYGSPCFLSQSPVHR